MLRFSLLLPPAMQAPISDRQVRLATQNSLVPQALPVPAGDDVPGPTEGAKTMLDTIRQLTRQELTWRACDALAAAGKKPSINLVREWTIASTGAKKGSDGDVQKDINGWFDDVLKLKRDSVIDGLPDAVGSLARDLWRLAVDCAGDALAGERDVLGADKAAADKLVAQAREKTVTAVELGSEGQWNVKHG